MKSSTSIILFFLLTNIFSKNCLAQTDGTLTFTFTPTSHNGYSGTKHNLAVWIQTSSGDFVKTKIRNAGFGTSDHLPTWSVNSGGNANNCLSSSCNVTDATTGATLTTYTEKTIIWDGKNVIGTINGTLVADGSYNVVVEETWDHGASGKTLRSFTFTKGPIQDLQNPPNDANFNNIQLNWLPSTSNVKANNLDIKNENRVFPNPSTGIINVEYKNVTKIEVVNIKGEIIINELFENCSNGKKVIDLSKFENGLYFINLYNNEKYTIFDVILNKTVE